MKHTFQTINTFIWILNNEIKESYQKNVKIESFNLPKIINKLLSRLESGNYAGINQSHNSIFV